MFYLGLQANFFFHSFSFSICPASVEALKDLLVLKKPIRGCSSAGGGVEEDPLVAAAAQLATFAAMGLLVLGRFGDLEPDLEVENRHVHTYNYL